MVTPTKAMSYTALSSGGHSHHPVTTTQTVYTVSYNSESHLSVLTQMWGSKWPQVLPFCLVNVAIMIFVTYLNDRFSSHKIGMTARGHTFLGVVVSFLLISRVNEAYDRYQKQRGFLSTMYREARQLVQYAFIYSANSTDLQSKEWRAELAYRTLILLRTTMAVIDYPTTKVPAWAIPELSGSEREDVQRSTYLNAECRRWAHGERSEGEESMRVPIRISYLLKKTIHSQSVNNRLSHQLQPGHEATLMHSVDGFLSGYYGIRQYMTTPVPFPFIQMARTLLFVYVFSIPFTMVGDESALMAHCFIVFLLTYGFVGLEIVAIEMDNPFGDDDNDFDNAALAAVAYEDTYMTILDVDGAEWVDKVRFRMNDLSAYHSEDDVPLEQRWLLEHNRRVESNMV